METISLIFEIASWPVVKLLQAISGVVYKKRIKAIFSGQHFLIAHTIRDIAVKAEEHGIDALSRKDLDPLALNCSRVLAVYLNRDPDNICCTIKFCCPKTDPKAKTEVVTVGRSHPDSRPTPPNGTPPRKHYIEQNTALCALMGFNDGETDWRETHPYFFCKNLSKFKKFKCSRSNFSNYYNTTLVFPLRVQNPDVNSNTVYGFLTFDSKRRFIFRGKGALETKSKFLNWDKYRKSVTSSPLINFCGSIADNLTSALYPHIKGRGV